tara:strand:- start:588 stop:1733 length:1146 start_codon:yes stop_codon:yes gene_type:complete
MKVLIGLTGSISSYKVPDLIRKLGTRDIDLEVVFSRGAEKFIGKTSFEGLIGKKVHSDLWEDPMAHIHLERSCDLIVVCPASAHFVSKLNSGLADDLLSNIILAKKSKVLLVPSMNTNMWNNPAIRKNILNLKKRGFLFLDPEEGLLACGEEGLGRLPDIDMIFYEILYHLEKKSFEKKSVLVTSGPTQEFIDDVRFFSNPSTGNMGFSFALNAWIKGADVTLVAGPGTPKSPKGIDRVDVISSEDMKNAITGEYDYGFFTAAVTDFSFNKRREGKPSKDDWFKEDVCLKKSPDILESKFKKCKNVIGFSVYSEGSSLEAAKKVLKKGAEYVVTNNSSNCFGGNKTDVEFFDDSLSSIEFMDIDKITLAGKILDIIGEKND